MVKVLLYDQAGIEYDVSYIQEIPLAITKSIADVKNPANRNSDFSKTINFPGTQEVERFFSFIWRLNNDLTSFDPRLKCRIKYYVNERIQLDGDLQLLKVNLDPLSNEKIYECSATGTLGNLFIAIGDKYLTDLDFSAYDHTLSKANVKNSWVPGTSVTGVLGSGYYYGLINYGQNQINSETEYHVKHMRPQLYKREYWAKIFSAAGKTWTSAYLDSAYYKSQVIPSSSENILLASSDVDNSQFYARRSSNQTGTANNCPYTTAWKSGFSPTKDVILFNQDNVLPYNDAGGQYNTGTGEFVVANTNVYDIITSVKFDITIANTVGTATNCNISNGPVFIDLQKWNGTNWTTIIVGQNSVGFLGAYASLVISGQVDLTIPSNTLTNGEKYRVVVYPYNWVFSLYTAGAVLVTTGTTTITPTAKTNSTYAANLKSTVITEGYTVQVNQAIPTEIKQIDWIMTEVKAANLYIIQDPLNENNYIIEPRDDGFFTGEEEWSDILDFEKKIEVLPMSELDAKRYEFTYKSDADEFNQTYNKSYQQNYGFGFTDCVSDFVRPTKKTELIYAATPMVGNTLNGLVLPKIYKNDSGVLKPFKSIIRSLYNGGVINLSFNSWTLKSSSGDEILSSYPFVGDCDNPYNPTLTLNWDTPKAVYYSYILATFTDNNLKNKYYSKMINQLSDKRSSVVKAWFNLDELRIKNFTFRKIIYVGHPLNSYFYVNSIDNYNVMRRESTLVTLLKLQDYDTFVPATTEVPEEISIESNRIVNGNYSNGENNTNYGNNSHIVGGSGNFIAAGAKGIQLRNATNVLVNGDVVNFIGDGISNRVITSAESNTVSRGKDAASVTLTSSTLIDASYNNKIVYLDGTAAGFTLTFDTANMVDMKVNFKRVDSTPGNLITITNNVGGGNVDTNAMPYTGILRNQNDRAVLTTTGVNIAILSL